MVVNGKTDELRLNCGCVNRRLPCVAGETPSILVASEAVGALRAAAAQCTPDKARLGGWLREVRVAESLNTFGGGGADDAGGAGAGDRKAGKKNKGAKSSRKKGKKG